MARFNTVWNNFLFGEVSPGFSGRTDTEQYQRSAKQMRNFVSQIDGGANFRQGTIYRSDTFASEDAAKLIPFIIDRDRKYIVVIRSPTIDLRIVNVNEQAAPNESNILSSFFTHVYAQEYFPQIQFAQRGTWLALVHERYPPSYIFMSSVSPETFRIVSIAQVIVPSSDSYSPLNVNDFINNIRYVDRLPYMTVNINPKINLRVSATGGVGDSRTLFAENDVGVPIDFFDPAHVGAVFRLNNQNTSVDSPTHTYLRVDAYVSTSEVSVTIAGNAVEVATRTPDWHESAWSNFRGWPRTVAFFQDRFIYGGSPTFPNTIWMSRIGNPFFMNQLEPASDAAFSKSIADESIAEVLWMQAGNNQIVVGTSSDEYLLTVPDASAGFSVVNAAISKRTSIGSAYIQNTRIGSSPVFVDRGRRNLREFVFNFEEDNYRATDLSIYSKHILYRARDSHSVFVPVAIKALAWQESLKALWIVDSNGGLVSMVRNREFGVLAFQHHVLGGLLNNEPPKVLDVTVVPSVDNTHDDVWLVVERTIGGSTKKYLEKLARPFDGNSLYNNSTSILDKPVFLDSAKMNRESSATITHSGFSHLDGQLVGVLADGHYIGTKTVSGGVITLDNPALEVVVGLPYRGLLQPLSIEAGSVLGSARSATKRVHSVTIDFNRSIGIKVGNDESSLDEIEFRPEIFPMDNPTPLFNGKKRIELDAFYDDDASPVIVQDLPYPCEIIAVSFEGSTND